MNRQARCTHLDHVLAADRALSGREGARNRAETRTVRSLGASQDPANEVVADEQLKGKSLVVDKVRPVVLYVLTSASKSRSSCEATHPELWKRRRSDEVPLDAHPQSVGERGDSERGDEDGDSSGDEERLRFGGDEAEVEVEEEAEEVGRAGVHADGPVDDEGERSGANEQERERDEGGGEEVLGGGVESVRAFADEDGAFLHTRQTIRQYKTRSRGEGGLEPSSDAWEDPKDAPRGRTEYQRPTGIRNRQYAYQTSSLGTSGHTMNPRKATEKNETLRRSLSLSVVQPRRIQTVARSRPMPQYMPRRIPYAKTLRE